MGMVRVMHCPCCPQSTPAKRKRPNGAGSLYYDAGKRSWRVSVSTPNKRLYAYARTLVDAEAKLAELLALRARLAA